MYEIRMIKETPSSITIKEFNGHEVHTVKTYRTGRVLNERFECLGKYSKTVQGYINQLVLIGYVKEKL